MQECTLRNLKKGVAQGLYRPSLNIEFVSRIYFIGVVGTKDDTLFPNQTFPKATLMEEYLEYHLRGIVTRKGELTLHNFINNEPND
jgi:hypothetical protein